VLAGEHEPLRQQVETERRRAEDLAQEIRSLRDELEQLRHERDTEQQAYEQALDILHEQQAAASRAAEASQRQVPAARPPEEPRPVEAEQRFAEIQSRLQQAESARTVLNDALKAARKQIEDLSVNLDEARLEQHRVRSILDGMGIHLI
jgi:hypothetical protein